MDTSVQTAARSRVGGGFRHSVHRWRVGYTAFIAAHNTAWELGMAALAILYVGIGFAEDDAGPDWAQVAAYVELVLTAIFIAEFTTRLFASPSRTKYIRGHWIDIAALVPPVRAIRIARLLRLLRLVRAFAGMTRAMSQAERLVAYRGLDLLLVALLATVFLSSAVFFLGEVGTNPRVQNYGDALWWALNTLTGGNTDIAPITPEGRTATATLLVLGVGLFTGITATLISFILSTHQTHSGPIDSTTEKLKRLVDLKKANVLTEAEFQELVARVSR